ncbi:MAG: ABC transporter ATP-binding protein [Coriobacteriia bacterium]|nr:ABC transporter ATP-binding protein [Coriobacteriia bacterium]
MAVNPGMGGHSTLQSLKRDPSVKGERIAPGTARRVFGLLKPYRRRLIVFLVLVMFQAIVGVLDPLIYREIINGGILGGDAALVVRLALLVAGLAILDAAVLLVQRLAALRIGEGLMFDMRTRVFAHIQRMGLAFFVRTQTGALVNRLNDDVQGAQQALSDVLSSVIGNLMRVGLVLVAMFALSWQLTLVALFVVPLFVVPARWLGHRIQRVTRERYDLNAQMNATMVERFNVSGALLVKLFGRAVEEDAEFAAKAGRVRDIAITRGLYGRIFFVALTLTASVATALVYGWGGVLSVRGAIDVGTIVALTAYLNRLYGPLTSLSNMQVDVMTALVSFERVFDVLDLPPQVPESPSATMLERGPARIEFDHVCFAYPASIEVVGESLAGIAAPDATQPQTVLQDVSFTVEPGQLVALVGPSGSGKTTMSYLIPRLYDATKGTVRVNGVDVRDVTLQSLREVVSMVTQDPHMFHDTIRVNLLYAQPDASEDELREALAGAQILDLIDSLPDGLDTVVGERGYRLSGGEKQRLAIARLLLKAPDVVVLDEATAHLDSESEVAVQCALATALTGRTSIVIAHRLSTVRDADRILVVSAGRIVEAGRHEELLAEGGLYAELYHTQFRDVSTVSVQEPAEEESS